jgi:hypothetical protein
VGLLGFVQPRLGVGLVGLSGERFGWKPTRVWWVRLAWVWWVCPTRDPAENSRGFGGSGRRWSGYGFGLVVGVGICRQTDLSFSGFVASFSCMGFRQCRSGARQWTGSGLGSESVVGVGICSLFLSPDL